MENLSNEYVLQAKMAVDVVSAEAHSTILKGLFQYAPEQRWLIYGRILNILYSNHYRTSIDIGNSQLDKIEETQGKDHMAKKIPAKKAKKKVAKKGY